jgi:predicted DCC family thiol-disulfide oxidoreductase YuxK
MRPARSGGQYSLVRALVGGALLGYALLFAFVRRPALEEGGLWIHPFTPVLLGGLGLAFAFGRFDRWAGLLLVPYWFGLHRALDEHLELGVLALTTLLVLQAFLPRAPYGSWDARGRVDPDGGWRAPAWIPGLANVALFGTLLLLSGMELSWFGPDWLGVARLACLGLYLFPRTRARAFLGLFVLSLVTWGLTRAPTGFGVPLLLLLVFDPAWVAPARRARPVRVFYDGSCALCHGFVRFLLAEDRAGLVRFAPLHGPSFERELAPGARAALPDSVVVLDDEGRPLVRSQGVRHVLATLGGAWRVLAVLQGLFPRFVRDLVYDAIARVRKAVFGTKADVCPLMPRELGARFDP